MKADCNDDFAIIFVELDGILKDMEQDLVVDAPVSGDPARNQVSLDDLDFDASLV